MAVDIPESLQELAILAVKKVFKKYRPIPDLKPLHDWFEDDGWDEVVMSGQGGCIYLESVSSTDFYDEYLKEDLDGGDETITDEMRIAFARKRIDFQLSQADDSIHAIELKVPNLPPVFLDCLIKGQGQGGWEVEWGPAYKSIQELLDSYGDMVVIDSETVSDNKILKLWRANEKEMKRLRRLQR